MRDYQEAPVLTDDEIKTYYDQNQRLFSGAQIHAAHILVKDETLAKQLRAQLDTEPDKFEELAKTNSVDTATAARGGDLGFFGQGRMVAEFERAAFALEKPGDLSPVVQTPVRLPHHQADRAQGRAEQALRRGEGPHPRRHGQSAPPGAGHPALRQGEGGRQDRGPRGRARQGRAPDARRPARPTPPRSSGH